MVRESGEVIVDNQVNRRSSKANKVFSFDGRDPHEKVGLPTPKVEELGSIIRSSVELKTPDEGLMKLMIVDIYHNRRGLILIAPIRNPEKMAGKKRWV